MGIREKINEKPGLTGAVVGVLVLVAVVVIAWRSLGSSSPSLLTMAFYTDDNGQTYFTDSINKVSPFERDGKMAYRADVFEAADGTRFVGVVYRHNASGRQEMEQFISSGAKDPTGQRRANIEYLGLDVRLVGASDRAWVPLSDPRAEHLINSIRGPDGEPATPVRP